MNYLCKVDYEVGPIDGTCASSWIPSKPYTLTKAALNLSTEGQLRDQEYSSFSTQSTDQSCNIQGEASVGETKSDGQSKLIMNSGYKTNANANLGHFTTSSLAGTRDLSMPPIYQQSFCSMVQAMHQLPYVNPYYCAVPASYVNPIGFSHPRVALPDLRQGKPIYVNPKRRSVSLNDSQTTIGFSHPRVALPGLRQGKPIYVDPKRYNAILRRRQSRAKVEAQNKLAKARKPYLHESRHAHAMKRARGSGDRFLNIKNLEDYESTSIPNNNNKPSVFNTENRPQHHDLDSQLYPPCVQCSYLRYTGGRGYMHE